jgi:hypothetical protein
MKDEPTVTLCIYFEPWLHHDPPHPPKIQDRRLGGVPRSTAQDIVQDFERYEEAPSEGCRRAVYTYRSKEGEADTDEVITLDFGGILAILIDESVMRSAVQASGSSGGDQSRPTPSLRADGRGARSRTAPRLTVIPRRR